MEDPDFNTLFRLLGASLRDRRRRAGKTQEDMIGEGFSARHWQQVEAGRPITLKTFVRACAVFGVKPSTLLRGVEREMERAKVMKAQADSLKAKSPRRRK